MVANADAGRSIGLLATWTKYRMTAHITKWHTPTD